MKKIIAVLLVVATCLAVLVSCGGGSTNSVDAVGAMYKNSEPTKIVAKEYSFNMIKFEFIFGYVMFL